MNQTTHPIEPEELMAYLDGELNADRESVAVAHLKECEECQKLVGGLCNTSQRLQVWNVAGPVVEISDDIGRALDHSKRPKAASRKGRHWLEVLSSRSTLAWGSAAIAAAFLIGWSLSPPLLRSRYAIQLQTAEHSTGPASSATQIGRIPVQPRPDSDKNGALGKERGYASSELQAALERNDGPPSTAPPVLHAEIVTGPMIVRTAQLALVTKDFDKTRESVETILNRHRGYVADLKVGGSTGSGRTLTSTLRVPADQLDATIVELKPLGRVETESQSGQDVTSQYVDLQARLSNARNTEQRLTDLLRNRTGKLSDVLEVEQEIDRVRGEIEQMEAERKNMSGQVSFATLNLTISEDYKAQLQVVPPSTSTRLGNAAVEGYRSVVDGGLSLALFLLSTGPSLLVWGLALFWPARFLWKKARTWAQ